MKYSIVTGISIANLGDAPPVLLLGVLLLLPDVRLGVVRHLLEIQTTLVSNLIYLWGRNVMLVAY